VGKTSIIATFRSKRFAAETTRHRKIQKEKSRYSRTACDYMERRVRKRPKKIWDENLSLVQK
jgi:hypothetical protein